MIERNDSVRIPKSIGRARSFFLGAFIFVWFFPKLLRQEALLHGIAGHIFEFFICDWDQPFVPPTHMALLGLVILFAVHIGLGYLWGAAAPGIWPLAIVLPVLGPYLDILVVVTLEYWRSNSCENLSIFRILALSMLLSIIAIAGAWRGARLPAMPASSLGW